MLSLDIYQETVYKAQTYMESVESRNVKSKFHCIYLILSIKI
jgi:hypothetical protein